MSLCPECIAWLKKYILELNLDRPGGKIMAEKKVFCIDCRCFISGEIDNQRVRALEACGHPKNLIDSFHSPKSEKRLGPDDINKKNNCEWFKPKPKTEK
jgi:hypothetical protein